MLERLDLQYVGPAPRMTLDFSERLNLLTGDNGLGKSFILDTAWWALSHTWPTEPGELSQQAWPQPEYRRKARISYSTRSQGKLKRQTASFDADTWSWGPKPAQQRSRGASSQAAAWPRQRKHRASLAPELVLYARADGGFSVWDPARNAWNEPELLWVAERGVVHAYQFSPRTLWNGLTSEREGTTLCNGLLRDWLTWQLKNSPEYETLCDVLAILSPGGKETLKPGPALRISRTDAREIPGLLLPYGNIPVIHASAGVKRILALSYLLTWAWHEHLRASELAGQEPTRELVLLIDELEAHLHPRWQRLILPALLRVATRLQESLHVQVIAATHAPLMLASVETLFDPERDALFDFDLAEDGTVQVKQADGRTRRAVVPSLQESSLPAEHVRGLG